jgi:hypothetical protein
MARSPVVPQIERLPLESENGLGQIRRPGLAQTRQMSWLHKTIQSRLVDHDSHATTAISKGIPVTRSNSQTSSFMGENVSVSLPSYRYNDT